MSRALTADCPSERVGVALSSPSERETTDFKQDPRPRRKAEESWATIGGRDIQSSNAERLRGMGFAAVQGKPPTVFQRA